MADETNEQQQTTNTPPPADKSVNTSGQSQQEDPHFLKDRLKRARDTERKNLLSELGIASLDDLKVMVNEAKTIKQASMTEAQRAQAALEKAQKDAQAAEERASALEARNIQD